MNKIDYHEQGILHNFCLKHFSFKQYSAKCCRTVILNKSASLFLSKHAFLVGARFDGTLRTHSAVSEATCYILSLIRRVILISFFSHLPAIITLKSFS
jgi:hypothetical protein